MTVLETERLRLRRLTLDDAPFMLGLLNQPSFLRFIGDRGVRSEADAREYLRKGPLDSYARHGFGFYLVELLEDDAAIGICGMVDRPGLPGIDVGFALLPEYWRHGYAYEATSAVMQHARRDHGLERLLAITALDNERSIGLLEKLGFSFVELVRLPGDTEQVRLFAHP